MGFWGAGPGGSQAGGWSRDSSVFGGLGGSSYGRGLDGWNDEELGQVIDPKVVRRLFPYLLPHKRLVTLAFFSVLFWAVA
jgi:hypothetical protein